MLIRLHGHQNNIIVVNTDNIACMIDREREDVKTNIYFPGEESNYVEVRESLTDILNLIAEGSTC